MYGRPANDHEKSEHIARMQKFRALEKRIFRLLSGGKFEELERLGDGSGLKAQELASSFCANDWPPGVIGPRIEGLAISRKMIIRETRRAIAVEVTYGSFDESLPSRTLSYSVVGSLDEDAIVNIDALGGTPSVGAV